MTGWPPRAGFRSQPPLSDWAPRLPVAAGEDRTLLRDRINRRAGRLGTAPLASADRWLATGHQAFLWHPGILAKDLALQWSARRWQAAAFHLIVDQDVHEVLGLLLPAASEDRLVVQQLRLGHERPGVPTGYQPPALDPERLSGIFWSQTCEQHARRGGCAASLEVAALNQACRNLPVACHSLAEQMAVLLHRLKQPYAGDLPIMLTSDLVGLPCYRRLLEAMRTDARRCVRAYNAAVRSRPEARLKPLRLEPDRVELPLWAVRWQQPRQPVFADLADREIWLTFEDGQRINEAQWTVLPRALPMTALLRSVLCDLFVHGTGGGVYDQVMADWWTSWAGGPGGDLAPMTVATADLYLDFQVPVGGPADLAQAIWRRHSLPHNIDRFVPPAALAPVAAQVARKQALLAHMDDDRDRRRRRAAFDELHQINERLAESQAAQVAEAEDAVDRARAGLVNRAIAGRRDWPFALYPPAELQELVARVAAAGMAPAIV